MPVFVPAIPRPDGSETVVGDEGNPIRQDDDRTVTRPGAKSVDADYSISGHDLIADGDYTTGIADVGGASSVVIAAESNRGTKIRAVIEFYDGNDNLLTTLEAGDFPSLGGAGKIKDAYPLASDHVQVVLQNDAGDVGSNEVDASINYNAVSHSQMHLVGELGNQAQVSSLNATFDGTSNGLTTYLAPVREDFSGTNDELRSRLHDTSGTQVDPRSDAFAFANFAGQDITTTQTLDLTGGDDTIPPRADTVSILANVSGAAHVDVVFYDDASRTNTIGTITESDNSSLGTDSAGNIIAEVEILTPFADVDVVDDSGVANDTSASAYAR